MELHPRQSNLILINIRSKQTMHWSWSDVSVSIELSPGIDFRILCCAAVYGRWRSAL
jgi:hypothetical protein